MKVTINWIKRYLNISKGATLEQQAYIISSTLTNIGLEAEELVNYAALYNDFIIVEILKTTVHPNAKRLKICIIRCSNNPDHVLQIVCGASNARAGIKGVLAPIGAIMPYSTAVIKNSTIRGVESQGMLCSAKELNLGEDIDDIIEIIDNDAYPGMKFAEYYGLNDILINVNIPPNRGDCANILGVSRELSAADIGIFSTPAQYTINYRTHNIHNVHVIDNNHCSQFALRYISNVDNTAKASDDIGCFLKLVGKELKNPLVDISNFVMLDIGWPNHIYDADKIEGDLIVRKSIKGEIFVALGGTSYTLPEDLTVIADNSKIIAIAGVIGSELVKVDCYTTNILIEVAEFCSEAVTRSGRALNLLTDARFRFERHIDATNAIHTMDYITSLVLKRCGGEAYKTIFIDNREYPIPQIKIQYDFEAIKHISGFSINEHKAQYILQKLGFIFQNDVVLVPEWRKYDVCSITDLTEEVLRIMGLSNIPLSDLQITLPVGENSTAYYNSGSTSTCVYAEEYTTYHRIYNCLLYRGLDEIITWSFAKPEYASIFAGNDNNDSNSNIIKLLNPISTDLAVMRINILASMIPVLKENLARSWDSISVFEIGKTYSYAYRHMQANMATGLRVGWFAKKGVHNNPRLYDFYDIKADVEAALVECGISLNKVTLDRVVPSYYHPTQAACFRLNSKILAYCGALHPLVVEKLDITSKSIMAFEIFLDNLPDMQLSAARAIWQAANYQPVNRDFAFVIDSGIPALRIIQEIHKLKIDCVEDIKICDVYTGPEVGMGKKSVALSVKLRPRDKTFTEDEINALSDKMIGTVSSKLGAALRT